MDFVKPLLAFMSHPLVLLIVGFGLGLLPERQRRKRLIKTHWAVLGAEVDICAKRASVYLTAGIKAPVYRLPTMAMQESFGTLLREADLSSKEYRDIGEFFQWAEDINRGLDNADETRKSGNFHAFDQDVRRLEEKGRELLDDYLPRALAVLEARGVAPNNSSKADAVNGAA